MTINDILREHGLSQTELSRRLGIPLRTVQDWAGERRTPSDWILNLIQTALSAAANK